MTRQLAPDRRHRRTAAACVVACAAFLCACAGAPLPIHPPQTAELSLELMAGRAAEVHTVRAEGIVRLERADGQTVSFDAVLMAQTPDRLRLRAWKLGQAAFDITLNAEGLWVWSNEQHPPDSDSPPPAVTARGFAQAWSLLTGTFFAEPGRQVIEDTPEHLVVERAIDGGSVRCTIDRPTLTALAFDVFGQDGTAAAHLELSGYRMLNARPWATKVRASGAQGAIEAALDEVEFNTGLPDAAFRPPARAVKQP